MYRFILLFLLYHFLSIIGLHAQSDDMKVVSREVLVSHKDSLERARIKVSTPKRKLRNPKKYFYWFYSGSINCNQGAYNENPLHGHYFVYNKTKQLITKGFFNNGKKGGKWMYWYADGTLKRVERWHWGSRWGKTKTYNEKGEIIAKYNFKKGILQGKQRFYHGDSVNIIRYIKGIEKPKRIKSKQLSDTSVTKKKRTFRFFKKVTTETTDLGKNKKSSEKKPIIESSKKPAKQKRSKEEKDAIKALKQKEKTDKKSIKAKKKSNQ